jgi:ribosomal protein S18 acetylase RimI-like enzyme
MMKIIEADLSSPTHAAAVVDLIAQLAVSEFGRRQPMTPAECAALIPSLARYPSKRVLLASRDSAICGVAVCFIQVSTFSGREMLKIHDLFVSPDQRRRGIGKRLVEAAIACAQEMNCAFINVEVATDNPAAIRLYGSLRFTDWITPTKFLELRL